MRFRRQVKNLLLFSRLGISTHLLPCPYLGQIDPIHVNLVNFVPVRLLLEVSIVQMPAPFLLISRGMHIANRLDSFQPNPHPIKPNGSGATDG
jgi:hypothetical protein